MRLARCAAVGGLALACVWAPSPVRAVEAPMRPRVIVSSDFPPLDVIPGKGARAGDPPEKVSDPDDIQSMVRCLLYANEIDVEGLVASAGTLANVARKQNILDLLDVYGRVVGNLQRHDPRYPDVERLRAVTWQGRDGAWGTPDFGAEKPTLESILGAGKDSEASDAIIRVVDGPDPRPVWFLAWGGSREVAQAIWTVRATRSPADLERFVGKLRLYLVGRQDRTAQWMLDSFPGLFVILTRKNYEGMFWPDQGGWGGRFVRPDPTRNHWFDDPEGPRTVWRWRADYQGELATRIGWSSPQAPARRHTLYRPELGDLDPKGFTGGVPIVE